MKIGGNARDFPSQLGRSALGSTSCFEAMVEEGVNVGTWEDADVGSMDGTNVGVGDGVEVGVVKYNLIGCTMDRSTLGVNEYANH